MKSNFQNRYALNKFSESTEFDSIHTIYDLKSELMMEHVSKILVGSIAAIVLVAGLSTEARASTVLMQDTSTNSISISPVNSFYNSHGVTSSIISPSTTITAAELQGINLFISYLPANPYTSSEIVALDGFMNQGGRILFMGDYGFGGSGVNYNNSINADISALGGTMASDNLTHDSSNFTATVSNGQILPSFLTTGVNSFNYAAVSGVIGSGFTSFFLGSDLSTVFGAYQQVGPGGIALLTDITNIQSIGPLYDNGQFYLNVANAVAPVPIPAAFWLFSSALASFGLFGKRCTV